MRGNLSQFDGSFLQTPLQGSSFRQMLVAIVDHCSLQSIPQNALVPAEVVAIAPERQGVTLALNAAALYAGIAVGSAVVRRGASLRLPQRKLMSPVSIT